MLRCSSCPEPARWSGCFKVIAVSSVETDNAVVMRLHIINNKYRVGPRTLLRELAQIRQSEVEELAEKGDGFSR